MSTQFFVSYAKIFGTKIHDAQPLKISIASLPGSVFDKYQPIEITDAGTNPPMATRDGRCVANLSVGRFGCGAISWRVVITLSAVRVW